MSPSATPRRVLGIDPGLQVTGYAVLEYTDDGPRVNEAGVIRSAGGRDPADMAQRVKALYDGISEVLTQWKPSVMVVEQLYAHYLHPRTAILMAHARGAFFLAGAQHNIPVLSYAATRVKKLITGHGRASKEQMQLAITRELNLAAPPEPHDVADALSIALCHYFANKGSARGPRSATFIGVNEKALFGDDPDEIADDSDDADDERPTPKDRARMITQMTGMLTRIADDEVRLRIGPIEYQVLVPEAVRRMIQLRAGSELTLHITEYLEGNSGGNRFVPRRIGFLTETELDFFDLFCTVEKIGAKKALKAMARPVKEIADAIARQDVRWLSTLPGIGAATAEQIVTTLKRKILPFTMSASAAATEEAPPTEAVTKTAPRRKPAVQVELSASNIAASETIIAEGQVIEDVYQALMGLGHTPIEARAKLDSLLQSGKPFKTVSDGLTLIYAAKG